MKEPVGSSLAVTGSNSATVIDGPTPGRMPITVPSVTPIRAHNRLSGVSATAKPCMSAASVSMSAAHPEPAVGQRQLQELGEKKKHHQGQREPDASVPEDALAGERAGDRDEQDGRGEDETHRFQ